MGASRFREEGRILFREGEWEKAAESFTKAIEASCKLPVLLTNRALCNQKLERWELVEKDAREAIEHPEGSTSVKAHYLLGKALLEQKKFGQAMESLLKAMSLSSSPDFKSYRRTRRSRRAGWG
ncbi:hypothetical protein GUITHDRAFT_143767 [Guillardia theta CCMP2712]|uniref:RING-type E3 ubiquitin transferase n=1 Tax=Guillardia theta (strain CCMP2712) TaxID=905079 RepID=L1ITK8_GUITC|nr:hypothetical protein GUITHDRAFT_143767 [Guillardia theta CCMP2712]EKX39170.1 hypothetical protein GUITHDRAFT_143767 [Guillardia theta CCMP2712]|eukprot:XP_005826150.1 hypothetical protein GUITHDRAFT_143767 [Guillardia theta CCMP2712]